MNQKKKLGRKVISYVLALMMVFSTFTGIVPGTSLTAKAESVQTYKINIKDVNYNDDKTYKSDTKLPLTITGSDARRFHGYSGVCYKIVKTSGDNVSIDGTSFVVNGEGTSVIKVYSAEGKYATFSITVTKNITATATGYTGTFDNDEHGVSVDVKVPSSGNTIKYGTQSGTYDLEESPKYGNAGNYTVYYQVTADGYNTKTGSVLVSIAKATPTINTKPVASAIYYGQSLADSSLSNGTASVPGTFAWKDNTIQPDVTDSDQTEYEVVFTPEDTANYNTVSCNVKLTVNKADPDVTDPTGLTATYGQILEDVTLPEVTDGTWSFDDPQTSVGNVGTNEFAATYTPTDTTRYKIKHTILSVTVGEVDKTALDNAISLAETYYNQIKDNTDYTDIVNSLNSAIDAAKAVKNNPNVTSETVAEAVTTMNTAVDDTKAAEAVIAKIIALPAAEDVKHTDVDAIHEARAAYDKLTDSQKGMINETITQKLKDCEEALINKIATAIENIEKVTRDNKDDVRTLLDSYDKLYDTEKDAVDKKLGRAGTKKISDLEEVLEVTEKIENLADPDNIDLTDEKAITLARTAYELLSDSQKALVSDEILSKLTAAEEKFASVKAQDSLVAAKTSATERLEDYAAAKAKSDATEAEKKAYDDVVAAEKEKINAATDKEAVADALTKAKAAVDAALAKIDNDRATAAAAKKAMAEADKAVADAKTSAETANTAANEAVSNEYVSASDKQAIEDAKEAVDVAVKAANELSETATAVEKNEAAKAIEDVVEALNEAVDKANINSAAAKAEAEKLAAAKNNAKDRLEDVYDSKNKSDYREAQQKELEEAKKAGDKAIDAAMTSDDAIKELEAAKVALNAVKTNDQLTREEKAAADAAAAKAAAEKLAESKAKEANAVSLSAKLKVSQTGKKLNISWGAVKDAEEYGVFVQYNGKSFPETATVTVKSGKTKVSIKKLNEKALNLKKSYKVYVVAYRTVNGKKTVVGKSIIANVAGKQNTKYSNPEKLTIKSAKSVTLNIGKASKIKAKVTLSNKNKKHLPKKYGAKIRYKSSDTSIATVSESGKIKGIKKGTCTIYVYSINGLLKKVKITVK